MRDYAWKIIRWPKTLNNKEGLENSIKTFSLALSKKGCFGQILDAQFISSEEHLRLAIHNVQESIQRKRFENLQPSTQLLLRIAGESQFQAALPTGLNPSTKIAVLVAVGPKANELLNDFLKENGFKTTPYTFKLTPALIKRLKVPFTRKDFSSTLLFQQVLQKAMLNRVALALV